MCIMLDGPTWSVFLEFSPLDFFLENWDYQNFLQDCNTSVGVMGGLEREMHTSI